MSSEIRVCLQCKGRIGSMRGARAKFCAGIWYQRNVKQVGKELRLSRPSTKAKKKGSVLFHDCIFGGGGGIDPFVAKRCKCRKLVSEEKAQSLIARGEALDFATRTSVFMGGAIVQIGKLKRTGGSATVEKAHISRLVEKPQKKAKEKAKTLEELPAAVQRDKAERFEEEKLRLEIYGELTASARQACIVEVDPDVYDAAKAPDWGRPLFTNFKDERTPAGIGVVVDRF